MKIHTFFAGSLVMVVIAVAAGAETTVLNDAAFPYRIVCRSEWSEESKNDTLLQLRLTDPAKKTRFQLKKYTLDSTYSVETMRWSRINYAINTELAGKLGTVIFSDTSKGKRLGDLRAFELGAFYTRKLEDKSVVWWGEYSRWTEYHGFGYFASVICDTADLNSVAILAGFKTMLDSVFIRTDGVPAVLRQSRKSVAAWHGQDGLHSVNDLLGRKMDVRVPACGALSIQQGRKKLLFRSEPAR